MTFGHALRDATIRLSPISDAPELDAERLLLHTLNLTESSDLYRDTSEKLSEQDIAAFNALVQERLTGKPLAYILGSAEFYGRPFYVNEHVLIPRPDTETLIEKALEYIADHNNHTVADIGTGSGCIAITLALEVPTLSIIATDISLNALEVAKQNAAHHGVAGRIEFLHGDMLQPLKDKKVDLLVSNPPYVPTEALAKAGRARDTKGLLFEPSTALDGGVDGQIYVEEIKKAGIPAIVEGTGGNIFTFDV